MVAGALTRWLPELPKSDATCDSSRLLLHCFTDVEGRRFRASEIGSVPAASTRVDALCLGCPFSRVPLGILCGGKKKQKKKVGNMAEMVF